jgi:hypothetical protein
MTPEAKVKIWVDKWLDREMPGHWRYKPRGGPFGQAGTSDYLICWQGIFVALEIKAEGGELTALQLASLKCVERSGGIAAVIRGRDSARLAEVKRRVLAKWNSE